MCDEFKMRMIRKLKFFTISTNLVDKHHIHTLNEACKDASKDIQITLCKGNENTNAFRNFT